MLPALSLHSFKNMSARTSISQYITWPPINNKSPFPLPASILGPFPRSGIGAVLEHPNASLQYRASIENTHIALPSLFRLRALLELHP